MTLKNDVTGSVRSFRHIWLAQYSPWLAYSSKLKGGVCIIYCILFSQTVHRGYQGAFITCAFTKYKDFHESVRIIYHLHGMLVLRKIQKTLWQLRGIQIEKSYVS